MTDITLTHFNYSSNPNAIFSHTLFNSSPMRLIKYLVKNLTWTYNYLFMIGYCYIKHSRLINISIFNGVMYSLYQIIIN